MIAFFLGVYVGGFFCALAFLGIARDRDGIRPDPWTVVATTLGWPVFAFSFIFFGARR